MSSESEYDSEMLEHASRVASTENGSAVRNKQQVSIPPASAPGLTRHSVEPSCKDQVTSSVNHSRLHRTVGDVTTISSPRVPSRAHSDREPAVAQGEHEEALDHSVMYTTDDSNDESVKNDGALDTQKPGPLHTPRTRGYATTTIRRQDEEPPMSRVNTVVQRHHDRAQDLTTHPTEEAVSWLVECRRTASKHVSYRIYRKDDRRGRKHRWKQMPLLRSFTCADTVYRAGDVIGVRTIASNQDELACVLQIRSKRSPVAAGRAKHRPQKPTPWILISWLYDDGTLRLSDHLQVLCASSVDFIDSYKILALDRVLHVGPSNNTKLMDSYDQRVWTADVERAFGINETSFPGWSGLHAAQSVASAVAQFSAH